MNTKLKLITSNAPSIICDGDTVIIESLAIQNQDLHDYMKDKVDPIEAFTDLIESALTVRKISNSSAEAEKLGLAVSLIENGIELGNSTTLLDVQYRMNDQIMQFSNQQFYESKLSSSDQVKSARLIGDDFEPVEFIDTAGSGYEEEQDELGGIFNLGEINLIQQRLTNLEVTEGSIGIISPYRLQINKLREVITDQKITIQTIDGFQGEERDLIYISFVRSNDKGEIGFLSDIRRTNVALTRARKKLVMIGDSATLAANDFYKNLIDYCEEQNCYRSAWEFAF